MHSSTEDQIRIRAYQLWEADGCPDGQADHYWHRAAALEPTEIAAKKPARRAKPAKAVEAPAVAEPVTKRRRTTKAA